MVAWSGPTLWVPPGTGFSCYHTGQGASHSLRQRALRARCMALTPCVARMVPAPGVRNAVRVAADVGRASGSDSWSARRDSGTVRATPSEEGFLRCWSVVLVSSSEGSTRAANSAGRSEAFFAASARHVGARTHSALASCVPPP